MSPYAIGASMVDGANFEIDGFDAAEGTLNI